MWQLAHGLEWVAATGLIAALVLPHLALPWLSAVLFFVIAFCVVLLLSVIASWTARLGMDASVRFYWRFALGLAVVVAATELWTRMHS
jgi:formate hydrogenlyase subunit 4